MSSSPKKTLVVGLQCSRSQEDSHGWDSVPRFGAIEKWSQAVVIYFLGYTSFSVEINLKKGLHYYSVLPRTATSNHFLREKTLIDLWRSCRAAEIEKYIIFIQVI